MRRYVVRYFSAALVCLTLRGCASSVDFVGEQETQPPKPQEPQLNPIIQDRIVEVLHYWDPLLDKSWDPYPGTGSIRDEEENLIGSGVLISPIHVLTAAHVADHVGRMFFMEYDEDCIAVDHVDLHPLYDGTAEHDIAVLTLEESSDEKPHTRLFGDQEDDTLQPFTPLTVVGNSFDLRKMSEPFVFRYYGRTMERPHVVVMLPTYASIWHGDSGGPIFTPDGRLLGIVTHYRMFRGRPIENGAASVEYYNEWIREITPKKKTPPN